MYIYVYLRISAYICCIPAYIYVFIFRFVPAYVSQNKLKNICSVRQIDATANGADTPLVVASYCLTVNIFEFVLGSTTRNIEKYDNFGFIAVPDKHLASV